MAARTKAIVAKVRTTTLPKTTKLVEAKAQEAVSYDGFSGKYWRQLPTYNPLERIIRMIKRRTRVAGALPDSHSAPMLAAARFWYLTSPNRGRQRFTAMENSLAPARQRVAA